MSKQQKVNDFAVKAAAFSKEKWQDDRVKTGVIVTAGALFFGAGIIMAGVAGGIGAYATSKYKEQNAKKDS